jgi:hypothetical protein
VLLLEELIEAMAVGGFGDELNLKAAGLRGGGASRDRFHCDDSMEEEGTLV